MFNKQGTGDTSQDDKVRFSDPLFSFLFGCFIWWQDYEIGVRSIWAQDVSPEVETLSDRCKTPLQCVSNVPHCSVSTVVSPPPNFSPLQCVCTGGATFSLTSSIPNQENSWDQNGWNRSIWVMISGQNCSKWAWVWLGSNQIMCFAEIYQRSGSRKNIRNRVKLGRSPISTNLPLLNLIFTSQVPSLRTQNSP